MRFDPATERQNSASTPHASTWLSANAGSGKTKVLTDRVARLLLAGVLPQNILCLTYTKAAASEMQNRLFRLLGEWAMKPDEALRADLVRLGEAPGDNLGPTRSLFARAIETPGGLKIQTIHSFCAALLRRFPLEAGVSPQFREMDERAELILREEVVEAMAMGVGKAALDELATYFTSQDFGTFLGEIVAKRTFFTDAPDEVAIWRRLGLAPGMDEDAIIAGALAPGDDALVSQLLVILQAGSQNEVKLAGKLVDFAPEMDQAAKLRLLQGAFLTQEGQPLKKPLTKVTAEGPAAHLVSALIALMERLALAADLQKALFVARKTRALYRFARPFLAAYEARKQQRGWLDFDDLINKAGDLLSDPALAAWVLYRLDGGIDHILVDEAQDTSPAQWKVIRLLAQEFTSGEGAREVARTVFVVGDPKQSIYSFQGADPREFTRMKTHFQAGLRQVGQPFQELRLEHSFRSSSVVLELVDHALDGMAGLEDEGFRHVAFFDKPGRVDLWPLVPKAAYEEARAWFDTSDITLPETHTTILARSIAEEISRMLAEETLPAKDGSPRPVEPRDILILVRTRSSLFEALIRACKAAGLPIAGADRLKLGAEMAVKDLTALLKFLATPEDDLSLAAVLRSPLCGLSEGALYDLAAPRPKGGFLWNALRDSSHKQVLDMLTDLRDKTDFLRPYELLERVLTQHRGRENLLARLGREAEDGMDALLAQALAYENTETPSLTGFLEWLDAMEVEIKRQMDSAGNLIRVMSVHGAKGLEAPIVFLPDCAAKKSRNLAPLLEVDGGLIWRPGAKQTPVALQPHVEKAKQADLLEDARLLYVAATRAANWLIIAAAGEADKKATSWHDRLAQGLQSAGAVAHDFALGKGLRHESGSWPVASNVPDTAMRAAAPLPEWSNKRVPTPAKASKPLSPSDLGGAKALAGEGAYLNEEMAKARGRQLHLLLEILPAHPRENWPDLGRALLAGGDDVVKGAMAEALINEVSALLTKPELRHVFAPGTLAEVNISANLPVLGGASIQGSIDRLIVGADQVTIIDYKSNAVVPQNPQEVPLGILRQMGAYMEAIRQIYPEHKVKCAILWTAKAELMPIPSELAHEALAAP